MTLRVARAVNEPQVAEAIVPERLGNNVINVGVSVVAGHKTAAQLADAAVAGYDGQPGALPRRGAVASLRR